MEVPLSWPTEQEFRDYLRHDLSIAETSRPDADAVIDATDRVLTLVTCNYDKYGRGRTLVVCVPQQTVDEASRTPAA